MKVFKFGGASVKDADGVKNLAAIVKNYTQNNLVIVVSAMGKTTNTLERYTNAVIKNKQEASSILEEIRNYHLTIINHLFPDKSHSIYTDIENDFVEIEWGGDYDITLPYDMIYDQIVCMGEIISTKIVAAYLNSQNITTQWMDARDFIKTDNNYREGRIDWELTEKYVTQYIGKPKSSTIFLTQGFIGGTSENYTTTLGREGSDYTAAIIAYCLDAKDMTIWKDVPGVLNADPKWFSNTQKIDQLSYQDAIELAYYGATVIHPKTIQPIQSKKIPLYVKSFLKPDDSGTVVNDTNNPLPVASFIFKVNQILISISAKDFSFIVEDNLSAIFELFSKHKLKINLMHNSAISFSICTDYDERKVTPVIEDLSKQFKVLYNTNVELVTIRYYNPSTLDRVSENKTILLEQRSRYTAQMVMK